MPLLGLCFEVDGNTVHPTMADRQLAYTCTQLHGIGAHPRQCACTRSGESSVSFHHWTVQLSQAVGCAYRKVMPSWHGAHAGVQSKSFESRTQGK